MAKLSEKQLIILTLTLTMLPTLVVCYRIYKDYEEWKQVKSNIQRTQDEIDKKNKDIYQIPKIKRELDNHAYTFEKHVKILPSQRELDTLIRNLYDLANKSDITNIEVVKPLAARASGRRGTTKEFAEHNYSMSFNANYRKVADFVNAIETNERFLKVSDIRVAPISRTDEPLKDDLAIDLKIVTFSYTKSIEGEDVYKPKPPPTPPVVETTEKEVSYVSRSNWRNPYETQLRRKETKLGPGDPPEPGPVDTPDVAEIDRELLAQQSYLDELNRKLKSLQIAYKEKRYGDTIPRLEEFEVAWRDQSRLTNDKLKQQADVFHNEFKRIRKTVLEETDFIREWANLRLEEIQQRFQIAEKSNKERDYRAVVGEHKKMAATLENYLGRDLHPDIQSIVTRAGEYAERSGTRLEFKELPLRVVGLAYLYEQPEQSRAVVVYDEQSRELDAVEWPYVEENEDLKLYAVADDGVMFLFKKELIHKPMDEPDEEEQPASARNRPRRGFGPGSRSRR